MGHSMCPKGHHIFDIFAFSVLFLDTEFGDVERRRGGGTVSWLQQDEGGEAVLSVHCEHSFSYVRILRRVPQQESEKQHKADKKTKLFMHAAQTRLPGASDMNNTIKYVEN